MLSLHKNAKDWTNKGCMNNLKIELFYDPERDKIHEQDRYGQGNQIQGHWG